MDSYYPNVEMVLVEDVNDIVDPLDTVEMDAEVPAIKLELDDNIESDAEFRLDESESYEAKECDEWIERNETPTSDIATEQLDLMNKILDDNSSSEQSDDNKKVDPEERQAIETKVEIVAEEPVTENVADDIESKPTTKKTRVSLAFGVQK